MRLLRALIGLIVTGLLLTACLGQDRPPLEGMDREAVKTLDAMPWLTLGKIDVTGSRAVTVSGATSWSYSITGHVRQAADTFDKANTILDVNVLKPARSAGATFTLKGSATASKSKTGNYWTWKVNWTDDLPADKPEISWKNDERKNTVMIDSDEYAQLVAEQGRREYQTTNPAFVPQEPSQQQTLDALTNALSPILANSSKRYLGTVMTDGGDSSDFAVTFTRWDDANRKVEAEIEYPRIQVRARMIGDIMADGLTLTEGQLLSGPAQQQPRCSLTKLQVDDGSEMLGEASCAGQHGTVTIKAN